MGGKSKNDHRARGFSPGRAAGIFGAALVFGACTAGCGNDFGKPPVYARCGGDGAARMIAEEVVAFNWDGGVSRIHPDTPFDGVDLTQFETTEGGTLADYADEFKQLVHDKVGAVYCDLPEHPILLLNADEVDQYPDKTTVFFCDMPAPNGPDQVGEAEYDPCDRYGDDEALIYGPQFTRLGGPYSVDQWATMFANTAAHEIGHTLGYAHVTQTDQPEAARSVYVELMLASHTISQLQSAQRIVIPQATCPDAADTTARTIEPSDPGDDIIYICSFDTH